LVSHYTHHVVAAINNRGGQSVSSVILSSSVPASATNLVLHALVTILVCNTEAIAALAQPHLAGESVGNTFPAIVMLANPDKEDLYFQHTDTTLCCLVADSGVSHLSHIDSWHYNLDI
jgi:hypothetical protein